jgi:folate-dependent phosphoribosylglycinamide formyltransferase PurN
MSQIKARPRLLVLGASGKNGGSGPANIAMNARTPLLNAEVVFFSSNPAGGMYQWSKKLGVPFYSDPGPFNTSFYKGLVAEIKPDHVTCSGWPFYVVGIEATNIHPAILPYTAGLYGDQAHAKALELFHQGVIKWSAVHMHYILGSQADLDSGEKKLYDVGPIFLTKEVPILEGDDVDTLQKRANKIEHGWQSSVLELLLEKKIFLHEGRACVQDFQLKTILGIK